MNSVISHVFGWGSSKDGIEQKLSTIIHTRDAFLYQPFMKCEILGLFTQQKSC